VVIVVSAKNLAGMIGDGSGLNAVDGGEVISACNL